MKKILLGLFFSSTLVAAAPDNLIIYRNTVNIAQAVGSTNYRITNSLSDRDFYLPNKLTTEWTSVVANTPSGLTITALGASYKTCLEIKTDYPNAVSGRYMLDAYNNGSPVAVYCDMVTNGGGWTLVMKSTGADRTGTFDPSTISSNWSVPFLEANLDSLSSQTAFQDGVYQNMPVQEFMIRSLTDTSKKLVWTQGSNSPNLKFMIDGKVEMRGKIYSGGVASLDYRSGCDVGNIGASTFAGVMVSDHGSYGTSVNAFNGSKIFNDSWMAAMVGWGSDTTDYSNLHNVSGGFGSLSMVGASWNLSRHVHGMGNGCNGSEWAASSNYGSQTMNPHALFVREGTYKKSCKEINDATSGMPSGVYTIKPGSTPIQVYCDMTNDGGGWTLIMSAGFLKFSNEAGMGSSKVCTTPYGCDTDGTSNFYRGTTLETSLTQFKFTCDLNGNAMSPGFKAILVQPGNFIRENILSPGRSLFDLMTDGRRGWAATNFGDYRDGTQNDSSRMFHDVNGHAWSDGNWQGVTDSEAMQLSAPPSPGVWGHHHYGAPTNNNDGTYTAGLYSHYCGNFSHSGKTFSASEVQTSRWWIWVK